MSLLSELGPGGAKLSIVNISLFYEIFFCSSFFSENSMENWIKATNLEFPGVLLTIEAKEKLSS